MHKRVSLNHSNQAVKFKFEMSLSMSFAVLANAKTAPMLPRLTSNPNRCRQTFRYTVNAFLVSTTIYTAERLKFQLWDSRDKEFHASLYYGSVSVCCLVRLSYVCNICTYVPLQGTGSQNRLEERLGRGFHAGLVQIGNFTQSVELLSSWLRHDIVLHQQARGIIL